MGFLDFLRKKEPTNKKEEPSENGNDNKQKISGAMQNDKFPYRRECEQKLSRALDNYKFLYGQEVGYDPSSKELVIRENASPDLLNISQITHEYSHAKIIYGLVGGKSAKELVGLSDYRYVEWFDELNADIVAMKTMQNSDRYAEGIKLERMAYENGTIDYEHLDGLARTCQFTELAYNKKMAKEIRDTVLEQAIDGLFKTNGPYSKYKQNFDAIFKLFDKYGNLDNIADTYKNILNNIVSTAKQGREFYRVKLIDLSGEFSKSILWQINVFIKDIELICQQNFFSGDILEYATIIYIKIRDYELKLLNRSATPLVAVYLACKQKGLKTTLEEIESKTYPFPPEIDRNYLEKITKKRLKRARMHLKKIQKIMPKINKKALERLKALQSSN